MSDMMHLRDARVLPEWVDYNGHMNDGYFAVAFSKATDLLLDEIGLDDAYRKATGFTIYTLSMQIRYLQEVKLGEPISTFCQILEHDSKRIRVWLSMRHTEQGTELATSEQLLLCVDQSGPKAANFPSEIAARLAAIGDAHASLPIPEDAGKGIRLKRV